MDNMPNSAAQTKRQLLGKLSIYEFEPNLDEVIETMGFELANPKEAKDGRPESKLFVPATKLSRPRV